MCELEWLMNLFVSIDQLMINYTIEERICKLFLNPNNFYPFLLIKNSFFLLLFISLIFENWFKLSILWLKRAVLPSLWCISYLILSKSGNIFNSKVLVFNYLPKCKCTSLYNPIFLVNILIESFVILVFFITKIFS